MITGLLLAIPIGVGTGLIGARAGLPSWLGAVVAACLTVVAGIVTRVAGLP